MTVRVRVRQVAADRRSFNVEMCRPDIDNVSVGLRGRWPLTTGVAQGRYYCISPNRQYLEIYPIQVIPGKI